MTNRRKVLMGTGAVAVTLGGLPGRVIRSRDVAAADLADLVIEDEEREQLLYELARLDARYYTEEGVAMVLACEDLAAKAESGPFVPDEMNERFSSAFSYYAEQLDDLRRDLVPQDAVALLELLALRDFESNGGAGL